MRMPRGNLGISRLVNPVHKGEEKSKFVLWPYAVCTACMSHIIQVGMTPPKEVRTTFLQLNVSATLLLVP